MSVTTAMFVYKMLQQAVNLYQCANAAALVANSIDFFAATVQTDTPSIKANRKQQQTHL